MEVVAALWVEASDGEVEGAAVFDADAPVVEASDVVSLVLDTAGAVVDSTVDESAGAEVLAADDGEESDVLAEVSTADADVSATVLDGSGAAELSAA